MKLKVIIHEAEEGGYWAEVPSDVLPKVKHLTNFWAIFTRLLRTVYL